MSLLNPDFHEPTEKQKKLINLMQDYGIYKFEGKSFEDARDYISSNYELFKEQKVFLS